MKKQKYKTWCISIILFIIGLLFAFGGIYVGETDDAPGAAFLGFLLMAVIYIFTIKKILRMKNSLK